MELTGAGRILYDHASRALNLLHSAEERIDYEGVGGSLSLSICAGDSWGNAILPAIVAAFTKAHPEIDVRLDIVGSDERMAGLSAGNYELSYGILLPRHEATGKLRFKPMMEAPYIVYASQKHPLRALGRLPTAEELLSCGWLKHKFEYDHDPARWQSIGRRYALSTNTTLSSLELIRQTDLLMSTSEINAALFARHGVTMLCPDPETYRHISGLHTLAEVELGQAAKLFKTWCEKQFIETVPGHFTGPLQKHYKLRG